MIGSAWRLAFGVVLLSAIACGGPPASHAASWLEMNTYLTGPRYDGDLPTCDAALGTIAARFAEKEGRFWNSDMQILGFDRVRQTAYRPWAVNTIPRRFVVRSRWSATVINMRCITRSARTPALPGIPGA